MRRFTILLVILASTQWAAAQITMRQAVQCALENHPHLKVAKSEIAIAQARLIDAGKLENPVFEFALQSQTVDGPDREGSIFVGYSQKFPITGKLLLQRDLGVASVRLACAEVLEVERDFIHRVQEAYIEAAGKQLLIRELRRLESDTEKSITLARGRLAQAQSSELELATATTEKLLASQNRRLAEAGFQQSLAELRPYLGMKPGTPLTLTENLEEIISTLRPTVQMTHTGNLKRSDIIAAEVRKQKAGVNEQLARAEAVEDWEIAAGYESLRSVDEPVGVERDRFVGLGVKIPLPVRQKGQGRIAEARAETEQADHRLAAAKVNALGEVGTEIAAVQSAQTGITTLANEVLPQLRNREAKTREAYADGLIDFSQVILLQRQQSQTREAIARAKLEQAHALARLQYALGSHPLLKDYCETNCTPYKPGTEPVNAPRALAVPVAESKPGFFRKLGQQLIRK